MRDGRTSSETLRHAAGGDAAGGLGHAVGYAVLDRAGRLQLPREMIEPLGMRERVRLEAERDHIGVWPDAPRSAASEDASPPAAASPPATARLPVSPPEDS